MKASVKFSVTEDNGAAFFDNAIEYSNLSRTDVVAIETVLLQTLKTLNDLGAEKAKGKK
jgi:hypothetical protein